MVFFVGDGSQCLATSQGPVLMDMYSTQAGNLTHNRPSTLKEEPLEPPNRGLALGDDQAVVGGELRR
jgi:hypothetical protein